jgi:hypothetical protein
MKPQCLVCDKEIETDPKCESIAYGATVWRATGNYGSALYDPIGDCYPGKEWLEAYVCDDCLKKKGKVVSHIVTIPAKPIMESQSFEEYEKQFEHLRT